MEKKQMTTAAGRPVGDNQNSLTVGPRGPIVFEDFLLFEKMAHFNRERIPERVVHAKGSGLTDILRAPIPECRNTPRLSSFQRPASERARSFVFRRLEEKKVLRT